MRATTRLQAGMAVLGAGLIAVATWLDRVIRRPEDVAGRLDAEVFGVIPFAPRARRSA